MNISCNGEKSRGMVLVSLVVLLAGALGIRLVIGLTISEIRYQPDTRYYLTQAEAIRNGTWLNVLPNGYPLLIAVLSWCSRGATTWLPLWSNIVLSTAVVGLIYLISLSRGGGGVTAGVAALACAAWPNQLIYVPQLMSEVSATFFLAAGVLLAMQRMLVAAGLTLGFAATIRPTLLLIPLLMTVVLGWRRQFRGCAALTVASLVPTLVLSAISYSRSGEFALTGNFAPNIQVALDSYGDRINTEAWDDFVQRHQSQSMAEGLGRYAAAFRTHPVHFIGQRVSALWALWGPWPGERPPLPEGSGSAERTVLARLLIGLRFPLLLFAIIGVSRSNTMERDLWLIMPAAAITLVHTLLFAKPRYIAVAEPFLIVLALEGVAFSVRRMQAHVYRQRGRMHFERA